jgi:hypothetical protein
MGFKGRAALCAVVGAALGGPAIAPAATSHYEGEVVGDGGSYASAVDFDGSPARGSKVKNIEVYGIDAMCNGQFTEMVLDYNTATVKRRGKFSIGNELNFFKGVIRKDGTASGTVRFNGVSTGGALCETGTEQWVASKEALR